MLWEEVNALARGEKKSEVSVCFIPLMLQKDKKTTKNIQRLIHRRMEMWQENKYDLLIHEAEICDRKLPRSCSNMSEEQAITFFCGLCWREKYVKQRDS